MIQKDKVLHFCICFLIVVAGAFILSSNGIEQARAVSISSLITLVVAFGKEAYDKYVKKTKFDKMDIVADLIGMIAGIAIASW